ncbi:MAG: response regulator [bacterium]
MNNKDPLSVGEVARILRVSKPCVLNWINKGALKAFTTYGGHHRMWPADVKIFLDKAGMDIPFKLDDEHAEQRVLIIDDDPIYTNLMRQVIKTELPDVDVTTTDDGYEALILIGEIKPQLVVLDIKMPKLDGFKVLERLSARKNDHPMKVLVVSGHLDQETLDHLSTTIADYVIDKTTDVRSLISEIATHLNGSPEAAPVRMTVFPHQSPRSGLKEPEPFIHHVNFQVSP